MYLTLAAKLDMVSINLGPGILEEYRTNECIMKPRKKGEQTTAMMPRLQCKTLEVVKSPVEPVSALRHLIGGLFGPTCTCVHQRSVTCRYLFSLSISSSLDVLIKYPDSPSFDNPMYPVYTGNFSSRNSHS